jgi:hypothetical protein
MAETAAECVEKLARIAVAGSPFACPRDGARSSAKTPEYSQSRRDRKKVEMLFARLKRIMKLDWLRLRGLSGAHDDFLLTASVR